MKQCTLHILDEVNVKFEGLDVLTRNKMVKDLSFFLPHAKFSAAYKLGRWDGKISFCTVGGGTYLNLLDKVLPTVQSSGYEVAIEDHRQQYDFSFESINVNSYSHLKWPEKHNLAGQPIILRDHQVEAVNSYLQNLQGMGKVSTGSGKTIITTILSHKVEKYGRSILIVPNKDLVTQTERDYKNFGLDVGVFYGDRKEINKTHTICTWQSLEVLDKKSKDFDLDFTIEDFMEGVVAVICDEAHQNKADVLKKHLTTTFKNIPIRWGMTGTIPKAINDQYCLLLTIGPVICEVNASDLQEKGILSKLHINVLQVQDFATNFSDYQAELQYLLSDTNRLEILADKFQQIAETGNTLILVDRIESGQKLCSMIEGAVFISGQDKAKDRKEQYSSFSDDGKILVASYGIAAVGIDVSRIFNLILLEPGKSFVRVIQSIGRGVRTAADKDFVNIYDITSTAKYSKKHLTERKRFYKEEKYPFTIEKLKL